MSSTGGSVPTADKKTVNNTPKNLYSAQTLRKNAHTQRNDYLNLPQSKPQVMSLHWTVCAQNKPATPLGNRDRVGMALGQVFKRLHSARPVFLAFFTVLCFASCSTWSGGSCSAPGLYFHSAKGDLFLDCMSEGKVTNTIIAKAGSRLSQDQIEHVFSTLHTEPPRTVVVDIGALQTTVLFYDSQHRVVGILRGISLDQEPKMPGKVGRN